MGRQLACKGHHLKNGRCGQDSRKSGSENSTCNIAMPDGRLAARKRTTGVFMGGLVEQVLSWAAHILHEVIRHVLKNLLQKKRVDQK